MKSKHLFNFLVSKALFSVFVYLAVQSSAFANFSLECEKYWGKNDENFRIFKVIPNKFGKWDIVESTRDTNRGLKGFTVAHDYVCAYKPSDPFVFHCAKDIHNPKESYLVSRRQSYSSAGLNSYPNKNGVNEFYFAAQDTLTFDAYLSPKPWFYLPIKGWATDDKHPGPPRFGTNECEVHRN